MLTDLQWNFIIIGQISASEDEMVKNEILQNSHQSTQKKFKFPSLMGKQ
jgi:hypothetical protein